MNQSPTECFSVAHITCVILCPFARFLCHSVKLTSCSWAVEAGLCVSISHVHVVSHRVMETDCERPASLLLKQMDRPARLNVLCFCHNEQAFWWICLFITTH